MTVETSGELAERLTYTVGLVGGSGAMLPSIYCKCIHLVPSENKTRRLDDGKT